MQQFGGTHLTLFSTDTHFNISTRDCFWKHREKKSCLLKQIFVSPFVHIFAVSLFVAELEEPKIGISGKGLSAGNKAGIQPPVPKITVAYKYNKKKRRTRIPMATIKLFQFKYFLMDTLQTARSPIPSHQHFVTCLALTFQGETSIKMHRWKTSFWLKCFSIKFLHVTQGTIY